MPVCKNLFERQIVTLGDLNDSTGSPGGISVNSKGDVVANDVYGTLYDIGQYPGGNVGAQCAWSTSTYNLVNIVFDHTDSIWASSVMSGSAPATFLVNVGYPLAKGNCNMVGPSGGPTYSFGYKAYNGIAIAPS